MNIYIIKETLPVKLECESLQENAYRNEHWRELKSTVTMNKAEEYSNHE